jgi:hypothetical protein
MVSFLANPQRRVTTSDGAETRRQSRGNKWPGGWDSAPAFGRHPFERSSAQVLAEGLVEDFFRWLAYKARRRRDWRVVVRRTSNAPLTSAVLDQFCATKELAAARAEEVVRRIRTHGTPGEPG